MAAACVRPWLAGLSLLAFGAVRAADPTAASGTTARAGADVAVPALEAFADWPPSSMAELPYWLPWNHAAFLRASLFARPVFFVLTVDWARSAQQLEDEVLDVPQVLREINRGYVAVRANADLRPDLRERYQTGVWPEVALLSPQGLPLLSQAQERDLSIAKPITASALEAKAMEFFLREGWIYWSRWDALLVQMGEEWARTNLPTAPAPGRVDLAASERVERWMLGNADRQGGGFGIVPKYFTPWVFEYAALLERRGRGELAGHARHTLERFVASPLFDRVEGGLHRMATAPEFGELLYEKLLEPNVGLLRELELAVRANESAELRHALDATVSFLLDVLEGEQGGFFLAQVADRTSPDGGGFWQGGREGAAPPADPLVLAGPNAMAGAALLRAALVLGREDAEVAARRALDLVLERAYRPGRGVIHAIEPPGTLGDVYLVTQGSAAFGFADAYETTGDLRYLDAARDVARAALANLRQGDEGALRDRLHTPDDVGLLAQPRWPMRANVRMARALLRLGWHDADPMLREEARRLVAGYVAESSRYDVHGAELALAIEELLDDPLRIRLPSAVGADVLAWREAAFAVDRTWKIVSYASPGTATALVSRGRTERTADRPAALAPAAAALVEAPGADR